MGSAKNPADAEMPGESSLITADTFANLDLLVSSSEWMLDTQIVGRLIYIWLSGSSKDHLRALEELKKVSGEVFDSQLRIVLLELLQSGQHAAGRANSVGRLRKHYKRGTPPATRASLLHTLCLAGEIPPKLVEAILGLIVAEPVGDCIVALNGAPSEAIEKLINASKRTKLERGSSRTRLFEVLLKTKHSGLLASVPSWSSASLEAVASLTRPEECPIQILDAIEGEVVRTLVARETRSLHLWRILQLVTEFPHLARFVSKDILERAAARDDGGAALCSSLITSLRQEDLQKVRELEATIAALETEVAILNDSREGASRLEASLKTELESLRLRISEFSTRADSVFEAQIRQGRLDVINAYINVLEGLRGVCGTGVETTSVIEGMLNDMTRSLNRFGIESVGGIGERRSFDPKLDEATDPRSEFVEVLAPAYRVTGSEGLVLRKSLVRPAMSLGDDLEP